MNQTAPTRLAPLDESDWDPQLESILDGLSTVLNVHRVMAHHPELLAAWMPLRNHVVANGTLSPRHRELVILRLSHRAGVAYEWHHHFARASQAGISVAEAEAVRIGPAAGWADQKEALLLTVADELFDKQAVGDAVWAELTRAFTIPQILDLIVTVGVYTTLAMFINTTGVQIENEA
ncbi:MAG: carboxymuconolactone decarboxylase family protein [Acidimicrobiia bacterium]|nr:carboxymuconolactone decarboxylase family protein [Acidimicrobiia bacterium]MDH3397335.1 carboxymuconolactone decarboxylase family protein [Acidimicrobiia bacterium]